MSEDEHRITEAMLVTAIVEKLGLDKDSADIRVKEFRVTEGSNKGDNFACVMKVRIEIYTGVVISIVNITCIFVTMGLTKKVLI